MPKIIFTEFPSNINHQIHAYRDLSELEMSDSKMRKLLGYGQSPFKDGMLTKMQISGYALRTAKYKFKADKQTVRIAVNTDGYILDYANPPSRQRCGESSSCAKWACTFLCKRKLGSRQRSGFGSGCTRWKCITLCKRELESR